MWQATASPGPGWRCRSTCNWRRRPKTIDAYGRSLNDFLEFCGRQRIQPEAITREQVALYVQLRPPRGDRFNRGLPARMVGQRKFRQRIGGRVTRADGHADHALPGAGLAVDHPAARERSIVQMRGDIDVAEHRQRMERIDQMAL